MPPPNSPAKSDYECKGIWLVTAQRFLDRRYAPDALDAHLSAEARDILADPVASEWYPETLLAEVLAAMRAALAGGNAERYELLLEEIAEFGVHRFLSAVLHLTSPSFMLGRVPTLWRILRRGPAQILLEPLPNATAVRYGNFPFFADENYRLLARASIRVLLRLTGIASPQVDITDWTPTSLDILARHH